MSIAEQVMAAVEDGRLRLVRPRLGGAIIRPVLATEEVWSEIHADRENPAERDWWVGQRTILDLFITGEPVVCPTQLRQLDPPDDEIWEIKAAKPLPPLRFFGRFAQYNVFICTNFESRDQLEQTGDGRLWRDEKVRCGVIWRQLFESYKPLEGYVIHDYASDIIDIRALRRPTKTRRRRR